MLEKVLDVSLDHGFSVTVSLVLLGAFLYGIKFAFNKFEEKERRHRVESGEMGQIYRQDFAGMEQRHREERAEFYAHAAKREERTNQVNEKLTNAVVELTMMIKHKGSK